MKVLVNGIGNIGTTLLALLNKHRDILEIETIYALKNNVNPWNIADLRDLNSKGIVVCTRDQDEFADIDDHLQKVDYIFDCTNNGGGIANKEWYSRLSNLKGSCAQGSEKNFGVSFMSGVNNEIIKGEQYVHVVSCNTHSIAALLRTFSNNDYSKIEKADFVIVRRSEDIGNHQRLVTANVVARHLDSTLGTHHSIDLLDLLKTINVDLKVCSSDITTPSQLMHGVRFNIQLKDEINRETISNLINESKFVSRSTKFDSNVIFERGRRLGHQGRIYSHAIIIENNIIINGNNLIGWAFIPQEGNTLLSTIHAYLLQTQKANAAVIIQEIAEELIRKEW